MTIKFDEYIKFTHSYLNHRKICDHPMLGDRYGQHFCNMFKITDPNLFYMVDKYEADQYIRDQYVTV